VNTLRRVGLLLLVLAAPAVADEGYTIRPLGNYWYLVKVTAPVTLAPGERTRVIVYLDDVPGGVAGAPVLLVRPMSGLKTDLTLSTTLFAPVPYGDYPTPLVGGILSNDSSQPVTYRIKVVVPGRDAGVAGPPEPEED
jgi:hypothetical protein